MSSKMDAVDYNKWSNERLVERVTELECRLNEQNPKPRNLPAVSPQRKPVRPARAFDSSKYSTRFVALKFAYLGQRYNGFEWHSNNSTPLPTIEEELWKALMKARLIFPIKSELLNPGEISWEGCEYSKCGRTDKGVSAFGQVVGIRVRSNRPPARAAQTPPPSDERNADSDQGSVEGEKTEYFDPVTDELPYAQILNRILPEDIRILAWCPNPPPDFSARFSCSERRYRYFFTQPAFATGPRDCGCADTGEGNARRDGWLDIEAMRNAAKSLIGVHDFRNFCKIDPSKQITNFERRIFHADIDEIDSRESPACYMGRLESYDSAMTDRNQHIIKCPVPKIYAFTIHGSAFLWHQVRHIAAVMFLVGQGLEPPSIVTDLLDVAKNPRKPFYDMAADAPLVLWDCVFPDASSSRREDCLQWIYVGDQAGVEKYKSPSHVPRDGKYGPGGLVHEMWRVWRRRKIDELLAGMLLNVVVAQGARSEEPHGEEIFRLNTTTKVFEGGDSYRTNGRYTPLLQRERIESVDVVNARFVARKGLIPSTKATEGTEAVE